MKKNNQIKSENKPNKLVGKIILRVVSICGLTLVLFVAGWYAYKKFTKVEKTTDYALVEQQLSFCQELVTAKYRYSDIVTLKKSMMFAKSYSIVKYTGLIRAGINDITDCDIEMSLDGKSVKVKLPQTEVLGNEIVKMEVFDEQQSIFVPITTQEIFDEIEKAKSETEEEVLADGFLGEAKDYAARIIKQVLLSSGFEQVEVY